MDTQTQERFPKTSIGVSLTGTTYGWGRWLALSSERNYHFSLERSWLIAEKDFVTTDAAYVLDGSHNKTAIWIWDDAVAAITFTNEWAVGSICAASSERCTEVLDYLQTLNPIVDRLPDELVRITFWAKGEHGPDSYRRRLEVPTWDNVSENYSTNTQECLTRLLDPEWRPSGGGQLILWQGKPGTGKTNALRALARQWREWCDMHYITDPEHFFGRDADYMLEVLLNENDETEGKEPKWRLLIMEDAGELISADAKERVGAGLGRFLNAVDGLIGQGLRVLILVTTNEEIKRLHDAVARPGRCVAKIEFQPFTQDEARKWMDDHAVDHPDTIPTDLADLYLLLRSDDVIQTGDREKVGFFA